MSVIREDVVSIGFKVENNPFGELTEGLNGVKAKLGILDDAENSLKDVARESQTVRKEVKGLSDKLGTPPVSGGLEKPLKDTQKETKKADKTLASFVKSMADAGKVKLDAGMKNLAEGIKKPEIAMKKLAGDAKSLGGYVKKVGIPNALNAGLGKAVMGAGNLLGKLKDTAAIGFNKTIGGLKAMAKEAGKVATALGKGVGTAVTGLAKGVVAGIGATGIALGGATVFGVNSAVDYQQALNGMQAQTGASAAEAQELKQIMSSLYVNYMGEGYGDLANSISKVKQITGSAGGELEGLTNHALLLRDTFEYDVTESARSAKMMMDQFGISGDEAYNLIAQGTQKGLNKNGDLLDTLNEYGVHFKQMGFSGTEMMNMLVNGAESGTFSVDKLGDSIKEFGIRSKDGSKTSTEAYQALGLNAKTLTADFAEGGEKGKQAFDQVAKALAGMKDPVKQNVAGVSLFGTMWEDLGAEGVLAMSNLTGSVEDGTAALEEIGKVKYNDLKSNLGSLKRSIVDGLVNPIASLLTPSLNSGIEEMKGFVGRAKELLEDGIQPEDMGKLAAIGGEMLSGMLTKLAGALPSLIQAGVSIIDSLIEGIMQNEGKIADSLVSGGTSLTQGIIKVLPKIITVGGKLLTSLVQGIAQNMPLIIPAAVEAIRTLAEGLVQNVPLLIQSAISILDSLIIGLLESAPLIVDAGVQLIMGLVEGLIGSIDLLINGAINLILAITTGLLENIPLLVDASVSLVTGLMNGLIANIDLLINGAIQLIMGLLTGLLDNLPILVEGSAQLMTALTLGLIEAIPLLIEAVPQLVSAIVDTIMNTDWLKLGGDIVMGIGNGLFSGIQGLFGKGKDAGKMLGDGAAAGVTDGTSQLASAADTTATLAADNLKPDAALLNEYGKQMPDAVANGIQSGAGTLETAAGTLGTNTSNAMLTSLEGMEHTAPIGQNAALNLAGGISSNKDLVIREAVALGQEVTEAATPSVNVSPDMVGAQSLKAETQAMVEDSRAMLEQLAPVFQQAYHGAALAVAKEMVSIRRGMKTTLDAALADTQGFKTGLISLLSGINLFQTGVNIMSGLNQGMISMRSVLMGTAASTGKSISDSLNGSLDIHSPSRVTEDTGENTGLGLVKGIRNTTGEIKATARDAGDVTARNIAPFKSRYSPEASAAVSTRDASSQTNNYSPVFNLTLNGASASDSNERKVKRWVKEAWKNNMESMGRRNPKLQEV